MSDSERELIPSFQFSKERLLVSNQARQPNVIDKKFGNKEMLRLCCQCVVEIKVCRTNVFY